MGAHHYSLTPFEIDIADKQKLEKQFLDLYGGNFVARRNSAKGVFRLCSAVI